MNDFATKPVEPHVLYAKLAHWLRPLRTGETSVTRSEFVSNE
jgi:hypothetical protein